MALGSNPAGCRRPARAAAQALPAPGASSATRKNATSWFRGLVGSGADGRPAWRRSLRITLGRARRSKSSGAHHRPSGACALIASARVSSSTKWVKMWRTGGSCRRHCATAGAWPSAASSASSPSRHGLVGSSWRPPSRPSAGRRRNRIAPSGRASRKASPRLTGRAARAARRGSCSATPAARAAQAAVPWAEPGSAAAAGGTGWRRGPSAPARHRPPAASGVSAAASVAQLGRRRRQRRLDPVQTRAAPAARCRRPAPPAARTRSPAAAFAV